MSRYIVEQIPAQAAMDGDGVNLLRVFGGARAERFDPFLLMDEFGSEEANDYIGGFPAHPHRGFETITYMLQGKMEHRDHLGNVGLLSDNGVQWMTAGKGVIHSEMPKQTQGKMRGFQVWLNLPARNKFKPASYEDVGPEAIPQFEVEGSQVKALAGEVMISGQTITGYFQVPDTEAIYLDLHIPAGKTLNLDLPENHNTLFYVYEGQVTAGDANTPTRSQVFSRTSGKGELVLHNANGEEAKIILLAGIPLEEKIVQHGPFVMNSIDEINQAIVDYQNGTLTD